jgi:hypothetical protein
MQSDGKGFAEMIDSAVDWWDGHWRSILYSFLAGILFTMTCAWCSSAHAAGYPKPVGAPTIVVPDHGVEVGVWAAQTAIGHGVGVFERSLSGTDWTLCGQCLVDTGYPNLDAKVNAAGGAGPYVASKLSAINSVLASRYPGITPEPVTTLERVNQAVGGYVLRLINGGPVLGAR